MKPIYQCYSYTDGKSVRYVDSVYRNYHDRLEIIWVDKTNNKDGRCLLSTFERWAKKKVETG